MVGIRIKVIRGHEYAYARVFSRGRVVEKYIGPVKSLSKGVRCPRCGKTIDDETIENAVVSRLKEARRMMWEEKRYLKDYAQYEILGLLIDTFGELKKNE
jgi:hypothetical protein